jgi:hypothetical protein
VSSQVMLRRATGRRRISSRRGPMAPPSRRTNGLIIPPLKRNSETLKEERGGDVALYGATIDEG